jgi:hypothetical protein
LDDRSGCRRRGGLAASTGAVGMDLAGKIPLN